MTPEKISHEEFLSFIFSQPREKEVNMAQNFARNDHCGCLMVQFGRHKGMDNTVAPISAGFEEISLGEYAEPLYILEKGVSNYFPNYNEKGFCQILTYGEIQDFLTDKGEKSNK